MATTAQRLTALEKADVALGARITTEVNARSAAVNSLDARIDTLEAQMANVILRVGALEGSFEPPAPPDPPMPVASFNATPTTGLTPLTVQFTDTSTGSPTSWAWAFGDGDTSSAQNPSHVYTGAASRTATLTVTNATGSSGPVSRVISIFVNPPVPPPVGKVVNVSSIAALLSALADNTVDEIVVANGTYSMSYLVIGSAYASRTRPILVRAQTTGGVTLDRGGASSSHLLFRDGAHHQEWRGFKFANSHPPYSVIHFGEGTGVPVHHITLRDIEYLSSIVGPAGNDDQGIYFSWANSGGNHDILVDGFVSNADLWSQVQVFHDEYDGPGHDNIVRNCTFTLAGRSGSKHGVVCYSAKAYNWTFQNIVVTDALESAFLHKYNQTGITVDNFDSTGSGTVGFYSEDAPYPTADGGAASPTPAVSGYTFSGCSFD